MQQELGLLPETFVQKWFAGLQPQSSTQLPEVENNHSEFMWNGKIYIQWIPSPIIFLRAPNSNCQFVLLKNSKECHDGSHFLDQIRFGSSLKLPRLCIHHLPYGLLFDFLATCRLSLIPNAIGEWSTWTRHPNLPGRKIVSGGILLGLFHVSRFASQIWSSEKNTKSLILNEKVIFDRSLFQILCRRRNTS